jgi:hypothetical protein
MMTTPTSQDGAIAPPLPDYREIVRHYEGCLAQHGDSHRGVDWPNAADALKRYRVMLDVMRPGVTDNRPSLLDFGCGAAHLLDYIQTNKLDHIGYTGLDLSDEFVNLSRSKFPGHTFIQGDALDPAFQLGLYDYVVMNGVFTEKRGLTFEEMNRFFCALLMKVFSSTRVGIAFNVMSKAVDWERDDLFHMPTDLLINFLCRNLSRHFVIRNDYGLYEYTVYVYKEPSRG